MQPTSPQSPGSGTSDTDHLLTVTQALRRIAGDGDRVSLDELAHESRLTPAVTERAMCNIERVSPLSAKRVVEPSVAVTWEISL